MNTQAFWAVIEAQLTELRSAATADDVLRILAHERDPYLLDDPNREGHHKTNSPDHGFFAGSGGDDTVRSSLRVAGWRTVWSEASYYWTMQAPNGDKITYIEGDIERGETHL